MMMKYVSTISTTLVKWVHKVYNSDEMSFNNTHTNVQQFRSTSSVTLDLWEMGLDNIQRDDGIVKHSRSTQSVITNLWEGDCNLWLAPTQQRPHNSDPAGFNDRDSYGPATTQQQSHNRDLEGFKTTTVSKTNQKFPRQH